MIEGWPLYYRDKLRVGDPASNVGICTLWTRQEAMLNNLEEQFYAVCGNLYSQWGVNFIVRNILANPQIRYVVLCGADLSRSGEALLNFFDHGVDENGVIINSKGRVDREIPLDAVEMLRRSVQALDLREVKAVEEIQARIKGLHSHPLPPFAEPQVFPETKPVAQVLSSEKTGFRVEDRTVAGAWLKVLKLVMSFGEVKPSEYSVEQKELLNVMAVVTDEDPDNPFFPPWLPTTKEELEDYYPWLLPSAQPPLQQSQEKGTQLGFWGKYYFPEFEKALGLSYTYQGRLGNYRGVGHGQIKAMIEKLREKSYTRRAVAVTWDPLVDGESDHPPCLTQLLANIQRRALFLTAHFRSHDIYGAWVENLFALRKLQKHIASEVKAEMGPLTVISHSAHVYADKWRLAEELLEEHYPRKLGWKDDLRGNFHIYLEDSVIVAEHATTIEGKTGIQFKGKTAREVYLAIINQQLISLPEHAAYLGSELRKAELALNLKVNYCQDEEMELR